MNLYLDDDSAKGTLVARLRNTGHRIVLPADARLWAARQTHAISSMLSDTAWFSSQEITMNSKTFIC
jgi:hypothetical protein